MLYISTRGGASPQHFSDILLGGLAPDGGLFLPERYPRVDAQQLEAWRALSYADLAFEILRLYIADIPEAELHQLARQTYTPEVYRHAHSGGRPADLTPLLPLEENLWLQQLSNGPTLAFKDMAMQLLGHLFAYTLERRGETLNILGATSGDTGSAAEYAMRGKARLRVFMLSPEGKMSAFQRAQMYSLQDANIFNIAVRGMFDDAQDVVKAVSNDAAFKAQYKIGAVNSINWARVLARVIYYFRGYFLATQSSAERVSFAVPSGNFGNICAGHVARMMGLPIDRLILATNENDVLDEFFRTGVYRPRRSSETSVTSSPSMDISKASNFERFIFDLVGRDAATVRSLWAQVDRGAAFDVRGTPHWQRLASYGFVSGRSTHADRLRTIRETFERRGVMLDPHTADGLKVALEVRRPGERVVVLETAQPVKFEATIQEALGRAPGRPKEMDGLEALPQRVTVMDPDATTVKAFIENAMQASAPMSPRE
jgi:threonine synthase